VSLELRVLKVSRVSLDCKDRRAPKALKVSRDPWEHKVRRVSRDRLAHKVSRVLLL
jgi:hypothetical protein